MENHVLHADLLDPDVSDVILMYFDAEFIPDQDFTTWNIKIDGDTPAFVGPNTSDILAITMSAPVAVGVTWQVGTPEAAQFVNSAPLVAPFSGEVQQPL